ncbi:hypothetical protein SRHO_G00192400 [Serrasalmus rhombeus]
MAGLPPGDPQLVAMIVNHLKTQGLFDQFRRDCLADVDTKPAYLHLRQRVDNFVSNHLSNHTWSPQLNKNQLRNSIRQLVLQSGMLEQGVDRIVAQVVDPKIHHTFRPQVERVVRQFLSPGSHMEEEEPPFAPGPFVEKQEAQLPSPVPVSSAVNDPTDSLCSQSQTQDPFSSRTQSGDFTQDCLATETEEGEADMSLVEEDETERREGEEEGEKDEPKPVNEGEMNSETEKEREMEVEREADSGEVKKEEEVEEKEGGKEEKDEMKEKSSSKVSAKSKEESRDADGQKSSEKQHIRQRARERLKEEYSLEDSDLEGLSDITVSSVHTSDLSSFEGESEDDQPPSDSTEEGEITSEDDKVQKKSGGEDSEDNKEKKPRGARQGYIHKPFLYSRYYSDSDDEVTVEQRRRSAAKEKEERVLKRQQNRERLEEKRRQKTTQAELKEKEQSSNLDLTRPQAKEARKEKKVLEKKVALSRKRKRDSRKEDDSGGKRKNEGDAEPVKKDEVLKSKANPLKPVRKLSEVEEQRRKKSGSISEDLSEPRKILDKNRTHSFILDLEMGTEETLRQRGSGKGERHVRRDSQSKEKERREKDKEKISDERAKHKQKPESRKGGETVAEEKEGGPAKGTGDDKGEKKGLKLKGEKKTSVAIREGKVSMSESSAGEETMLKDLKKGKTSTEITKEKEKERTKGEKLLSKSDSKPLHRLDSTGSTEERLEIETTSEVIKKKDKHPKDVLKRSKSHTEVKPAEKVKSRQDSKDSGTGEPPKHSDIDKESRKVKDSEAGSKVKSVSEKIRSKSRDDLKPQSPLAGKLDKKPPSQEAKSKAGTTPSKPECSKEKRKEGATKEDRKVSEDRAVEKGKEAKTTKKASEKKIKESEKKGESEKEKRSSQANELSFGSLNPAIVSEEVQVAETVSPPTVSDMQAESNLTESELTAAEGSDSLTESDFAGQQAPESTTKSNLTATQALESDLPAPQAMDAVSNFSCSPALGIQSDLLAPQAVKTESELSSTQATNTESHLIAPQAMDALEAESNCTASHAVNTESAFTASEALDANTETDLTKQVPGPPANSCPESDSTGLTAPQATGTLPASDTGSTAVQDDMYDALSDITPEPEDEEEAAMRLTESQAQPCPLPADADALLTLMDVCASAAKNEMTSLPDRQDAVPSFQEADIKMKEAALTLLSMDPDLSVAQSPIATETTPICTQDVEPSASGGAEEASETAADFMTESESETNAAALPCVKEAESQDGDENTDAIANPNFEGMATDKATEEVVSEVCDHVQMSSLEAESEPKSEVSSTELISKDEPAGASGDASTEPGSRQTLTDSVTEATTNTETEAVEKQPEKVEQEEHDSADTTEAPDSTTAETSGVHHTETMKQSESKAHPKNKPEDVEETQRQPPRRGRPPKLIKQPSSASKSDGQEEDRSDVSEVDDRVEGRVTRKGRRSNKNPAAVKESASKAQTDQEASNKETEKTTQKKSEDEEADEGTESRAPRRGRSSKLAQTPQRETCQVSQTQEAEPTEEEVEQKEQLRRGRRSGAQTGTTAKPALKRKRSDQAEDSGKVLPSEEEEHVKRARDHSENVSEEVEKQEEQKTPIDKGEEKKKTSDDGEEEKKASDKGEDENREEVAGKDSNKDSKEDAEYEKEEPVKKTARRGRPSKTTPVTDEPETSEKKEEETEAGEDDEKEGEETKTRATTRAASRLEAEKNKPSKPSTRALSKLSGKEENSPSTRASLNQTAGAAKGRKREASSPAPRTRGAHKEEPASKRTKR